MVSLWVMPFLGAGAPEDMASRPNGDRTRAILRQVGEGDAVVGEDRVDLVREGLDRVCKEACGVHLAGFAVKLDEEEVRDAIDGEEHVDPAIGMAQLAAVDVDVADRRLGEATALGHVSSVGRREMP